MPLWTTSAGVSEFAAGFRGMRLDVTPDALTSVGDTLRHASAAMQASRRSMTVQSTALTGGLPGRVAEQLRHCEHSWARGLDRLTTGYEELADALDRVAAFYRALDAEVVP
jgi:hypothetical protein